MSLKEILNLQRPLVIPDVETTGVNVEQDRIVEFAFVMLYPVGDSRPDVEWRSLINPGRPIPPEVTKVHHISDADVVDKMGWDKVAPSIAKRFVDCDFAGKNVRFDLQFIAAETARSGVEWSYAGARVIDVDRIMHIAEPRTLSDLYQRAFGKPLEGAHGALTDVKATVEVLEWQFQTFTKVPTSVDTLHKLLWPGQIDSEGKFKFVDRVPTVNFGKKYKGVPMHRVDPSFWGWMQKENFSDEVKAIARRAARGEFPRA